MKKTIKQHVGLECLHCGAKIFSRHRHDFIYCNCSGPKIFVDGGYDYFRYGWPPEWKKDKDFKYIYENMPKPKVTRVK